MDVFKEFGACESTLEISWDMFLSKLIVPIFVSALVSSIVRPLGIPSMVSHILAGFIAGRFREKDQRSLGLIIVLDLYTQLGMIFQLFLIGLQINVAMVLKAGRKAIILGIILVIVPMVLVNVTARILPPMVGIENYKPFAITGLVESMTAFPVIACFLTELNVVNLEFCQIAFSSSMVSGILFFFILGGMMLVESENDAWSVTVSLLGHLIVLLVGYYLLKPAIRWMIKHGSDGKTMKEGYMCAVFTTLIGYCIFCTLMRISYLFGALLLGIMIPPGPPMGSSLVERLEFLNTWTIMPVFYAIHGYEADFDTVGLKSTLITEFIVILSCIGKFVGAFFPGLYYFSMSYRDATLLGLTMNAQGFIELSVLKMMMIHKVVTREIYTIMYVTIVVITVALVPIVTYLNKSSLKHKRHNIRTIQHMEPNTQLRLIACLYEEENVRSIMNFLKATNPSKDTPVNISIVHLMELVGRATPVIISHRVERKPSPTTAPSQRIINVFKQFEEKDRRGISVHPYTVVSTYASMDEYVYMLSVQKMSYFIVLPYHKNLSTGTGNNGIRTVNCNVLEKAPCSVGILIDRGLHGAAKAVLADWSSYHVAVVFLGGADDREALALGERISGHPLIELTVFRFREKSDKVCNCPTDEMRDEEMLSEFQMRTEYNDRVTYIEEVVSNPVGIIRLFESMHDDYQLIILGRRHDESSPLILGLTDWEKCTELGTLGDIFTTSGYAGNSTILVVHQQIQTEAASFDVFMEDAELQVRSFSQ